MTLELRKCTFNLFFLLFFCFSCLELLDTSFNLSENQLPEILVHIQFIDHFISNTFCSVLLNVEVKVSSGSFLLVISRGLYWRVMNGNVDYVVGFSLPDGGNLASNWLLRKLL